MSHSELRQDHEIDRLSAILADHENQLEAFARLVASVRHEIDTPLARLFRSGAVACAGGLE